MPRAKTKKEAPQGAVAAAPVTNEDDVVMREPPTSHQPSVEDANEDESMADPDAVEEEEAGDGDDGEEEEEVQRVKLVGFSLLLQHL